MSGVILWLLLWILLPYSSSAQIQCPYTEDDAVADTLEPAGYYPLEIGIIREYASYSGAFISGLSRTEIIADTLIDGDIFYKSHGVFYDPSRGFPITDADTSYSYVSVLNGVFVAWTPERGRTEFTSLFHDFNTCHDSEGEQNALIVDGEYTTNYTFQSNETIELEATKEFFFLGGVTSETYGYDLGLVRRGGDPNNRSDLTYARIDGQEYGRRLEELFDIRVTTEKLPDEIAYRVGVYPNPSFGATRFSLMLAHPGRATVRIYDILGRLVAKPLHNVYFSTGEYIVDWNTRLMPPGVYVAWLLAEGRPVARKSFVITR